MNWEIFLGRVSTLSPLYLSIALSRQCFYFGISRNLSGIPELYIYRYRLFTVFLVEFDLKPKVSKVKDYVIVRTLGSGTYGTVKVCNPLVSFICFSTHVPHSLLGCLVVGS